MHNEWPKLLPPPILTLDATVYLNQYILLSLRFSYKVSATVEDDSGTTTFSLLNKDVEILIGIPIEKVIDEISEVCAQC